MLNARDLFNASDFLFTDYFHSNNFNIITDDVLKYPATDIRADDENVYIDIAVTGIPKEHLSVEVDGNLIKIFHKKPKKDPKDIIAITKTYIRQKICKKDFEIAYKIDSKYDIQNSEVKVENGEMTIKIPLREEHIPVKKKLKIG